MNIIYRYQKTWRRAPGQRVNEILRGDKMTATTFGARKRVSSSDRADFKMYLKQCTDAQVRGVYEKERAAGRAIYKELAILEAERRGIDFI